jgi:hypothetical protein
MNQDNLVWRIFWILVSPSKETIPPYFLDYRQPELGRKMGKFAGTSISLDSMSSEPSNLNPDAHGKESIENRKTVLSLVDGFIESLGSPIEGIYVDFSDTSGLQLLLSPINIS